MIDRRRRAILVSSMLVCAAMVLTASPVAAECTRLDPWPSFTEAVRSAKRIVVGEVVQSLGDDSAGNALEFRFRVDEVLRGEAPRFLQFRGGTTSGLPLTICPGDSLLRVRVGDVLAFAFDARIASSDDPVLSVAWIRGVPDLFLMPGTETLTLARVRQLASLPATDTVPPTSHSAPPVAPVLLVLAGVVSFVVTLGRRPRRSSQPG